MTTIYFVVACLFFGLAQTLRYARWKHLLTAIPGWEFDRTFRGFILGQFFNIFVPFKIGDLIRAGVSAKKLDSVFLIFLTLVAERVLDATYLFLIFSFILSFEGYILTFFGLFSIFSITVLILFNAFLKQFATRKSRQSTFKEVLLIMFSIIGTSLRKGLSLKTSLLTIIMWICNLIATYFLTKTVTPNHDLIKTINTLYLSLSSPYLDLDVLSVLCLIGSILFASLFIYIFRLTRSSDAIGINSSRDDLISHPLSLGELSIILINTKKNEQIMGAFSGGSGATTVLIKNMLHTELIVRKCAVSGKANALQNQFELLSTIKNTNIISPSNVRQSPNAFSFDMPFLKDHVTFTHFLMYQGSYAMSGAMNSILERHRSVFGQDSRQLTQKTNWDSYINLRVNPQLRLLPVLQKFLYLQPDKHEKVLGQYERIYEFYGSHVNNFRVPVLKDNLFQCHGDLSTSNIMVGPDLSIIFIDLLDQKEHSSFLNDYAKLHFCLSSGYDTTNLILSNSATRSGRNGQIPNLVTRNSSLALDVLDDYIQVEFGQDHLQTVRFLSPLHALRVLPYRLEQDFSNTENWLDWALNYFSSIKED
jgi:hypothetical protein